MIRIECRQVELPATPPRATWDYGTAVLTLPGTTSVILALPSAGPRSPWCAVDLVFGRVTRGTGMPGPLRALVPARDGDPDLRPWVLGIHGLGRLDLDAARPTVTDVVRTTIGTYPATLVDYAEGMLAVGHPHRDWVALVSTQDGSRLKRLRASGQPAYRLPDGRLRMVAFHHGLASDVDTARHRTVRRHALPCGTGTLLPDGRLVALVGARRARVVVTPQGVEPADVPGGWDVVRSEIVVLDALSLEVRQRATAPAGAVAVLGADTAGRVVVSRECGVSLLEPASLAEVGAFDADLRLVGAGMVPGRRVAALAGLRHREPALVTLRW